jgi:hypothetical protein
MADNVVPMIHVPDVRATTDWYQHIGFTISDTYGNGVRALALRFYRSEVVRSCSIGAGGQAPASVAKYDAVGRESGSRLRSGWPRCPQSRGSW